MHAVIRDSRAAPAGRQPRVARPNGPPPAYDAVAEDWFDDLAAMGATFASPESQAVLADAPNFPDMTRFQVLAVEHGAAVRANLKAPSVPPLRRSPFGIISSERTRTHTRRHVSTPENSLSSIRPPCTHY